jgi:hypothetical protein
VATPLQPPQEKEGGPKKNGKKKKKKKKKKKNAPPPGAPPPGPCGPPPPPPLRVPPRASPLPPLWPHLSIKGGQHGASPGQLQCVCVWAVLENSRHCPHRQTCSLNIKTSFVECGTDETRFSFLSCQCRRQTDGGDKHRGRNPHALLLFALRISSAHFDSARPNDLSGPVPPVH